MLALGGRDGPGCEVSTLTSATAPAPAPAAMTSLLALSMQQVEALAALVRTPLRAGQRTLLSALLTADMHNRDALDALATKGVTSLNDFEWTKQLRYRWNEQADDVFVRQTCTSFQYGHEYLGNCPRLAITPLTDIYYAALTNALHKKVGGAVTGTAGTGSCDMSVVRTVVRGIQGDVYQDISPLFSSLLFFSVLFSSPPFSSLLLSSLLLKSLRFFYHC